MINNLINQLCEIVNQIFFLLTMQYNAELLLLKTIIEEENIFSFQICPLNNVDAYHSKYKHFIFSVVREERGVFIKGLRILNRKII